MNIFYHNKLNLVLLIFTILIGLYQLYYHLMAVYWTGHILPTYTNGLVFIYQDSYDTSVGIPNFVMIPLIPLLVSYYIYRRKKSTT